MMPVVTGTARPGHRASELLEGPRSFSAGPTAGRRVAALFRRCEWRAQEPGTTGMTAGPVTVPVGRHGRPARARLRPRLVRPGLAIGPGFGGWGPSPMARTLAGAAACDSTVRPA